MILTREPVISWLMTGLPVGYRARLMPAKYVRSYSKGQKNDFRDAEAIADWRR